jgi:hypothetical protein
MKILLGDFSVKVGNEDIFKLMFENQSLVVMKMRLE